jgi:hypothetical protein
MNYSVPNRRSRVGNGRYVARLILSSALLAVAAMQADAQIGPVDPAPPQRIPNPVPLPIPPPLPPLPTPQPIPIPAPTPLRPAEPPVNVQDPCKSHPDSDNCNAPENEAHHHESNSASCDELQQVALCADASPDCQEAHHQLAERCKAQSPQGAPAETVPTRQAGSQVPVSSDDSWLLLAAIVGGIVIGVGLTAWAFKSKRS